MTIMLLIAWQSFRLEAAFLTIKVANGTHLQRKCLGLGFFIPSFPERNRERRDLRNAHHRV